MNDEETLSASEMFNLVLEQIRAMNARLDAMNVRFNAVEEDIRFIKQGIVNLGSRVEAIENTVGESKLFIIGPRLETIEKQTMATHAEVVDIGYKMRSLNDRILDMAGDQRRLEDRVDGLERKPS